jgi:hypothetical protein
MMDEGGQEPDLELTINPEKIEGRPARNSSKVNLIGGQSNDLLLRDWLTHHRFDMIRILFLILLFFG